FAVVGEISCFAIVAVAKVKENSVASRAPDRTGVEENSVDFCAPGLEEPSWEADWLGLCEFSGAAAGCMAGGASDAAFKFGTGSAMVSWLSSKKCAEPSASLAGDWRAAGCADRNGGPPEEVMLGRAFGCKSSICGRSRETGTLTGDSFAP